MVENNIITSEISGVYTISDIDKFAIAKINDIKTNLLLNLNRLNPLAASNQATDLISAEYEIISKYFPQETIINTLISINNQNYNFIEIKNIAESGINDIIIIRAIIENTARIFSVFMKKIGVAIPTEKLSQKKN